MQIEELNYLVTLLLFYVSFLLQFAADARAESWQITNLVNFFYIF